MASVDEFENHCWKDVVPADDLKLYSKFRRETRVGPDPALLVIDLYNLCFKGGPGEPVELEEKFPNSCGKYAHAAIEPTQKLIAAARRAKLPIFYCTQDHRANNRPAGAISTKRPPINIQPGDYDIHDAFKPQPQDIIIYKQRASIFQGTPLISHLTLLGIRSLIVCGEATSGCVRASTVDAYSTGYHISVVEECTFDRAELTHKVNLFDIHHKYADVMHVDEVVAHLDGQSAPRA